ncbi:methylated-DNA--[protein]-cysteine S-methyltransferase [Thermoanaerobacterium sp. RBIITD]|uniref:methylated-DNA--[protein]-cysteine S-methyltransferase n=1 Tax=Thermoanaerobacterium sp. RBIITD TaxID=1550240 RepID=UPI000BB75F91|nr:methylated-DNA--[protein]-cysteine S-methyltransferase [Thermoanaerobacterium sp. RBIITD]SNX53983.1 methylated-DNA-[protein]-cysteine S-methyltransferase [Thermoanaerobacterium sp. RBIITD]
MICDYLDTAIGKLTIYSNGKGICRIDFFYDENFECYRGKDMYIDDCKKQLKLYFEGQLKEFNVKLDINGSDFQKSVWKELMKIPFGSYATYGEIAKRIGKPNAKRAVGGALNRNPVPIIIPCHRVIGADGSLTGFGGGLPIKEFLLRHEGIAFRM